MKILYKAPGEPLRSMVIPNELGVMQQLVDGYIEPITLPDKLIVICNEEGKLNGLELNRALFDEQGNIYDVIAGLFLVCGVDGDEFVSLTQEQQEKYLAMYRHPQMFIRLNGEIMAIPLEVD